MDVQRWKAYALSLLALALLLGQTLPAAGHEVDCTPEALEERIAACGLDFNCINGVMAEYNQACMGGEDGTGGFGGFGGMGGDMMQRIQACGTDQDCARRVMEEMQEEAQEEDPDTTSRMHERTVLPASWLQSYQEALVVCAKDVACWTTMMSGAMAYSQARCGTNLMSEATMLCHVAAQYEIHIEQAIAQQRLWRQEIRFEENAPGAEPLAEVESGTVPSGSESSTIPELADGGLLFLDTVESPRVEQILAEWESKLASRLPQEARDKIAAGAEEYPLESEPGMPPLVYEEKETPDGLELETRPTRRDWYYALTAVMLTDAGFNEGGAKGEQFLDAAFWSLLQAVKLKQEVEHYTNLGFHLNIRGELETASDILTYARSIDESHPDTYNNLAFSYAALGRTDEALALQENAVRLAPTNAHITSRLAAMRAGKGKEKMPHGGDFGEAFFRLGKRHVLREFAANKKWFTARTNAKRSIFGGTPVVPGPASWYSERIKDIESDYSACIGDAPEVAKGCPFGAGIIHPSCADAASPEEVNRTQHNRNVYTCRCSANALMARADAVCAWLDRAIAAWRDYENAWYPRLQAYTQAWAPDIQAVNRQYQGSPFKFPVEAAYSFWPQEFMEDSEDAWGEDIPGIAAKWYDLKTQVQKLKNCGTTLPPIEKPPKKPKPEPPPKVKEYGFNLFVVEFKFSINGNLKVGVDLGIIKGGYKRVAGVDGHTFTLGSGPVEFSYQSNGAPSPRGDSSKVTMTLGTNFLKFIPGVGGAAANIADQFISFGAKYQASWGDKTGLSGKASVESKSKIGFTSRDVTLTPATSMLN